MNNQNDQQKFVCKSCGSKSQEKAGTCCGAEREEKKEAKTCEMCGHEHKVDGSCECGCK